MKNLEMWSRKDMDVLRKNIRYWRKKKKLTQDELAIMSQCSKSTIINIERQNMKNTGMTLTTLLRIAQALEVAASDLFKDPEENEMN